jgi:RNA polymerase sigma-70 factor (ECF subfamily)
MSEFDADLVHRTLAGERSAFEALVAAHLVRAKAVARSVLGSDGATEDVVQEAFARAYSHLGQLTEPSVFPSWLASIVRNEAISWMRRNARHRSRALHDNIAAAPAGTPEEDPALAKLRQAMKQLSAPYREVLALKYEAGCSYDKIAETLGLSVTNVEKRLYRARQALLRLMDG